MTRLKLVDLYLFTIILSMTSFFGLAYYFNFNLYSDDIIYICIFGISLVFFLLQVFSNKKLRFKSHNFYLNLSLILILLIEFISTIISYEQSILLTAKEAFYYITPIFCWVTFNQFNCKLEDYVRIKKMIVYASIICDIIAIVVFVFLLLNINLLNISYSIRYGLPRFEIGFNVVQLGMIISISELIQKKNTKLNFYSIFFNCIQLFLIIKSRTVILYLFATFIIVLFIIGKTKWKIVGILLSVFLVSIVLLFSNKIYYYLSDYFMGDAGISIRFDAIQYYLNEFFSKPILGMGLLSYSKNLPTAYLVYGSNGLFYNSDVGFIGYINRFGIIGAIWLIAFFYKFVKNSLSSKNVFLLCFTFFLLISCINLIFMDTTRTMYIFFIYLFFDYEEKNRYCSQKYIYVEHKNYLYAC